MRKIMLTIFAILCCIGIKAQVIVVGDNCVNPVINKKGVISLNPTNAAHSVRLNSVELECNVLRLEPGLLNIEIAGDVKIKCQRIEMPAAAAVPPPNITISGTSGTLTIQCPGAFPVYRHLQLTNDANIKLNLAP